MQVLLVEDNEDDAMLLSERLAEARSPIGRTVKLVHVTSLAEAHARLEKGTFDAILLDLWLPDGSGLDTYERVHERHPETPIVILSGLADDAVAAEAVREGAQDYLFKSEMSGELLARSLRYAVERHRVTNDLERLVDERTAALQLHADIVHHSPIGILVCRCMGEDRAGCMEMVAYNPAAEEIAGWTLRSRVGNRLAEIFPALAGAAVCEKHDEVLRRGVALELGEVKLEGKSRSEDRTLEVRAFPLPNGCSGLALQDVTDRHALEEQMRHAQKMEAVGRLAGGVAHDLNNIFTAIKSFGTFAHESLHGSDPVREDVGEVLNASERGTQLVRQLLAFSRKQPIEPRVVRLDELVERTERMLRRIVGEDVDVMLRSEPESWSVKVDPGQFEQVLVNLVVNARDAMSNGGQLTIEVANASLGRDYQAHHPDVTPGDYVMMAVTDTGCGIDDETREHIFEPFFTTKVQGRGTGLGLSTVYGIVKQAEGHIWVYSELGRGTTFRIYVPRHAGKATVVHPPEKKGLVGGNETVLLVEDEAPVRNAAARALRRRGFEVLIAQNGGEALMVCEQHGSRIDLVVTDVIMPGMSGRQMMERIARVRPGLRALYISGYTENAIVHQGVVEEGTPFLQKPFPPDALVAKVRETLDRVGSSRPAPMR